MGLGGMGGVFMEFDQESGRKSLAFFSDPYLAGLGTSPGCFSKSLKPGASVLRLDSNAEIVGYRPASSWSCHQDWLA